jgi:hypothetical protein
MVLIAHRITFSSVLGSQQRMLKQAVAQVREVAIRVLRRGHALVHLNAMHVVSRQVFFGQDQEHLPRVGPYSRPG